MARAVPGLNGVRGSAALGTAAPSSDPAVASAEALAPGELRRVPVHGEWLGAVRVRSRYAALPLEAFDRAGDVLDVDEQGAYLQLLRLSYAEGRNFCRVTKKDLQRRLRVSERRLGRLLDVLAGRGFLRALHRDNRGTLWRVYLPREAFDEPLGDDVLLGRATSRAEPPPGTGVVPRHASPVVLLPARDPGPERGEVVRVEDLARQLAGDDPGAMAAAEAQIADLLAEGASPRQVAACVAAALERRGKGAAS